MPSVITTLAKETFRHWRSMEDIGEVFARNLERLLRETGLKQTDLAEHLGVHRSVISRMIAGEAWPSRPRVNQIAKFFGVSPTELMGVDPAQTNLERLAVELLEKQYGYAVKKKDDD